MSSARLCVNEILKPAVTTLAEIRSILKKYKSLTQEQETSDMQSERNDTHTEIRKTVTLQYVEPDAISSRFRSSADLSENDSANPDRYLTSIPRRKHNSDSGHISHDDSKESVLPMKKAKLINGVDLPCDNESDISHSTHLEQNKNHTLIVEVVEDHGYSLDTVPLGSQPVDQSLNDVIENEETINDQSINVDDGEELLAKSSSSGVEMNDMSHLEIQIEIPGIFLIAQCRFHICRITCSIFLK